jgi:hypothetical protein
MNSYILTRRWFDFAFITKEAKSNHTALFCWIIELNNRLGWKPEFGLPTQDTVEGLSIGNKNTYLKTLRDLAEWKFIDIVQESKNQYQSCIIRICYVKNDTAQGTALDTALIKHDIQHEYGTGYSTVVSMVSSIDTIDKPLNQETNKHLVVEVLSERELEIENAIQDYCQPQTLLEEEKEKSSAQKEKEFPLLDEAMSKVAATAHWRNAMEHHKLTDERRQVLFKIFYEMKEDNYRIRYPSVTDMASNFYYWVKTYQARESIQKLNENAVINSTTKHTANNRLNRNGQTDKRDGLRAFKEQSGQFLQQVNGGQHQNYPD